MKNKYFYLDESPYFTNKFTINLYHENFPFEIGQKRGSFNLIPARLMMLDYPDYLRFCRDVLGAELVGKGAMYVTAYFTKTEKVQQFIKLLNARMNFITYEIEHNYSIEEVDGELTKIPWS